MASALLYVLSQAWALGSLAAARDSPIVAELCGSAAEFSFGLQPGARAGSDAAVMGEGRATVSLRRGPSVHACLGGTGAGEAGPGRKQS